MLPGPDAGGSRDEGKEERVWSCLDICKFFQNFFSKIHEIALKV